MRPRRILVAVIGAVLVTGCVGRAKPVTSPEAVPGARPGGMLTVGILQPRSIAPWLTSSFDAYGALVVRTMCDTLTEADPVTGEPKPAVAESVRIQGANGMVVRLRERARFSDGSPARAKDVISTFSAAANATVASRAADVVSPIGGFAELNDPEELAKRRERFPQLTGLGSSEDRTFSMGVERAGYRPALSHPVAAVVKRSALEGDSNALEKAPVCVGPYVLAEPWEPGKPTIRLARSPHYQPANTAHTRGGQGWFDNIEFRVFPDRDTMFQQYAAGTLDVAFVAPGKAAEARQRFPADYVEALTGEIGYVGLPLNVAPFDEPAVRRALSLALDRKAVALAASGGLGEPAVGYLPPTLAATTFKRPSGAKASPCEAAMPKDPQVTQARQLLQEKKIDLSGKPLTISFNDEFVNAPAVAEISRQWREAFGLDVSVEPKGWEQWIQQLRQPSGSSAAYRWSWAAEYGDPYLYLEPLFHTKHIGADNLSRFSDPFLDFSVEDSAKKVNDRTRIERIQQAEAVVCASVPMVPVLFAERAILLRGAKVASALGPVSTDRSAGLPLLRDLYAVAL